MSSPSSLGQWKGVSMLATRMTCPYCSKQIRLRTAPQPGRRVLCAGCNRSFSPRPETVRAGADQTSDSSPGPAPVTAAAAAPRQVPENRHWFEEPSRAPHSPARSAPVTPPTANPPIAIEPSSPIDRGVLLGVVVVGLLVLAGSTILAIRFAVRGENENVSAGLAPTSEDSATQPLSSPLEGPATADPPKSPRPDLPDDPGRPPPASEVVRPAPPAARPPDLDAPPRTEPVAATAPERSWLPAEVQTEVNKAIDRGVTYLKDRQQPAGSWEHAHTTAYAALPALTLLECGVPADDPRVQKAVEFLRANIGRRRSGMDTYELSLALLFLDRLGDERDRPIIRSIALRLVAGQTADGGWTYALPELTPDEEDELEHFLQKTRPRDLGRSILLPDGRRLDPSALRPGDQKPLDRVGSPQGQNSQSSSRTDQQGRKGGQGGQGGQGKQGDQGKQGGQGGRQESPQKGSDRASATGAEKG